MGRVNMRGRAWGEERGRNSVEGVKGSTVRGIVMWGRGRGGARAANSVEGVKGRRGGREKRRLLQISVGGCVPSCAARRLRVPVKSLPVPSTSAEREVWAFVCGVVTQRRRRISRNNRNNRTKSVEVASRIMLRVSGGSAISVICRPMVPVDSQNAASEGAER